MVNDIGARCGGAEVVIQRTKKELERRGHQVRLLTGDMPPIQPGFSDYSFHSADATKAGKFLFHLYNPWARKSVTRAIAQFQPDIINLHIVTRFSPAGIKACLRIPTIMTIHYLGLFYPRLHKAVPRSTYCGREDKACCRKHAGVPRYYFELFRSYLHIRNFKQMSAIIVPSEYVKTIVEALGYGTAQNLGCPIDFDTNEIQEQNRLEGSILFAGRLEPEKEIIRLFDSFVLVHQKNPAAKLYIAGEGSLRSKLMNLIHEKELDESVELLGMLNKSELNAWYRKTKVVAVPSVLPEPFPLAGPEAMSFGVPVVASGAGGISEWLEHDYNGLVANPVDKEAFAEAILRLLEDEALYHRLSKNARLTAKRFQTEIYVNKLEELYEEALGETSAVFPTATINQKRPV